MTLVIRSLASGDTDGVVGLFTALSQSDAGIRALSATEWERFVHQPTNADGKGFYVATDGERLVGLITSSRRDPEHETVRHFRILVMAERRRQRIGTALLQAVASLDGDCPATIMQSLCPLEWSAALAFLQHLGFDIVETELEMECLTLEHMPANDAGPVPTRLEDVAGAGSDLARLHNAAYGHDISFVPYTAESMVALLADGAEVWVLREGPDIVAFCHVEAGSKASWIESLVVDPERQGGGLGFRLGAAVVEDILASGQVARLQVSDRNPRALHLYERLGFRQTAASRRLRLPRATLLEVLPAS